MVCMKMTRSKTNDVGEYEDDRSDRNFSEGGDDDRLVGFNEMTAKRHKRSGEDEVTVTSGLRRPSTVRHRGMGTPLMGTILTFASVPLRKMGTDLLGSWWPCPCV